LLSRGETLTPAELTDFMEKGFIVLRGIFSRASAEPIVRQVWDEMDESPSDPATWTKPVRIIEKVLEDLPLAEILTERYQLSINDLCGIGRWETNSGVGYWVNVFPDFTPPSRPQSGDWHLDIKVSAQNANSPDLGLAAMEFFTDIDSSGGGTAIRVGSHRRVAQISAQVGNSLNSDELSERAEILTRNLPVVQMTARAGDVLLMHPFTLHATSSNTGDRVRIAANRPITLLEPMNFNRSDRRLYSPVELMVVDAINRSVEF
jgi:hypothetical protein